jgi:hypothetical protein
MSDETELAALKNELAALRKDNAAFKERLAALEVSANRGLGIGTSAEASAGKDRRGTGQLAMDRASLPKHVTDAMVKATAGMVQDIVRTAKAPR